MASMASSTYDKCRGWKIISIIPIAVPIIISITTIRGSAITWRNTTRSLSPSIPYYSTFLIYLYWSTMSIIDSLFSMPL